MRIKSLTLALAAAALAAPAAQAHHAPAEHTTASPPSVSTWTASGREIDRLGPKHVALQHVIAAPAPAAVVNVLKPAGFNWGAAIEGSIAGVVAVVAVPTVVLTRRSRSAALPERSELTGA
ncbi:MAG: hypothetical protein E6G60_20220 [Actinobacteria bacterium]|nr:MAG: hypothetical protein E6G60_20220 [Actinomycetota bacterium]